MLNVNERKITATITAISPISHAGFSEVSTGNSMMFRRVPCVSLPGFPEIPVVSGNALRGIMRRRLMTEVYNKVGFTFEKFKDVFSSEQTAKRAWDKLYAALFCGGTLDGKLEDTTDPIELRKIREQFPALSLLGSALYTKMLPGMAQIGFAWLICDESIQGGLVTKTDDTLVIKAEDAITEIGQVRHIDRENADPEITGVTPMPITVECLAPGASLQSNISLLPQTTSIEKSCLIHGLKLIDHIGGKLSSGYGAVKMHITENDDDEYTSWIKDSSNNETFENFLIEMAKGMI